MFDRIKNFIKGKNHSLNTIPELREFLLKKLDNDLKSPKINLGQIQAALNNQKERIEKLSDVEFQVFSQWGDDGIIQYLVNKLNIPNKTFIEFGVENYKESNTRFLLINNNWSGYVIDGSKENIDFINNDSISWACELYTEAAFITAENINDLLSKPPFEQEIGILSIDIDGNDYWVWKAINNINPVVVIAEYNSLFGKKHAWTIPYDPTFVRYHQSIIYYGASLKALNILAESKGYSFIGCNGKGNNAYFVRNDKLGSFKKCGVEEGFVLSKFREKTEGDKRLIGRERINSLKGFKIFDIESNNTSLIDPDTVEY